MTTTRDGRGRLVVLCVQNLSVPEDRRVWREARTLAGAGYDVAVIAPRAPGQASRADIDGVTVLRFRPGREREGALGLVLETVWALAGTAAHVARLRARRRIAVLHAANPPDTFAVLGLVLRLGGTRYVYDQHDLCPELLDTRAGDAAGGVAHRVSRAVLLAFERLSYRVASLVIAPNGSYRGVALERGKVNPAAVVVVRSGPDELRLNEPRHEREVTIAFAGVMGHQDRVDVLLDAVAILRRRTDAPLVVDLIGRGDAVEDLRERTRCLGLDDVVRWAGWLTGDELADRLGAATIAVSLDDDTPFSRMSTMTKVPEYLALGLPCVIADLPENRVTADLAARYFRPADPADLADRLAELLDDPALLEATRNAARERAPALLWSHGAARLLAAYRWLLDGGPEVDGEQVLQC